MKKTKTTTKMASLLNSKDLFSKVAIIAEKRSNNLNQLF